MKKIAFVTLLFVFPFIFEALRLRRMDQGAVMQEASQDAVTMPQAAVSGRLRRRRQPMKGGMQRVRAMRVRLRGRMVQRATPSQIRRSWRAPEGAVYRRVLYLL